MGAQHTPGTWSVETEAEPDGDAPVVYVCHSATVCDVTTVCNLLPSRDASVDQRQANARLIAAAPDLLAALELILPMAKGYVALNSVGNNRAFISQAEAAIAKARGQA